MADVDELRAVEHPAKFSRSIIDAIRRICADELEMGASVLDPMGGVGGIHELDDWFDTYAVEIEEEWARQSALRGRTWWGDFFEFGTVKEIPHSWPHRYDAIITSITYGNRMADNHTPGPNDTSKRITYRHKLGRPLSENNSGAMQWGANYRLFHMLAFRKMRRLLVDDGLLVVNVSNHIRKGQEVDVVGWVMGALNQIGFELVEDREVETPRMGFGANGSARVAVEHILVYRRPSD